MPVLKDQAQEPQISSGQNSAWTFYSPNTDEGLNFEQAYSRLQSSNQKAFKEISADLFKTAGLTKNVQVHDAVGDWSDGAENSLLHVIKDPPSPEVTRYLAAWHGLLGNQKSVLHFESQEDGPDSVYQIFVPESSGEDVRNELSKFGIQYRTLVPTGQGHIVVIYDEKRSLRPNVEQFAEHYDATVREATGTGQYIGGATRTAARAAYRNIIRQFESTHQQVHQGGNKSNGAASAGASSASPAKFAASDKVEELYVADQKKRQQWWDQQRVRQQRVVKLSHMDSYRTPIWETEGYGEEKPPYSHHATWEKKLYTGYQNPDVRAGRIMPRRKVGNNTWLERLNDDEIGLRLHNTYVLRAHKNGAVTAHTGGWNTVTTRARLNEYAPPGVRFYSDRGRLMVSKLGRSIPFQEGMNVDEDKPFLDAPEPKVRKPKPKPQTPLFDAIPDAKLAARKAPEGGYVWRGMYYPGGKFLPAPSETQPITYESGSDKKEQLDYDPEVWSGREEADKWNAHAEQIKGGQGRAELTTPKGVTYKVRNGQDLREFVNAGGILPSVGSQPQQGYLFEGFEEKQKPQPKPSLWTAPSNEELMRYGVPLLTEKDRKTDLNHPRHLALLKDIQGDVASSLRSNPSLTDEHRHKYYSTMTEILHRIPSRGVELYLSHVKGIKWFPDHDKLTKWAIDTIAPEWKTVKGIKIAGAYCTNDPKYGRHILLDGGESLEPNTHHGTYSHELGHVFDGPKFSLSHTLEWMRAFDSDIVAGPHVLSNYAMTNPREGLAEFTRALYGAGPGEKKHRSQDYLAAVQRAFPNCSKFFMKHKLWPAS